METQSKRCEVLVISVGGTPEPVMFAMNYYRPDYVIFFSSKESSKITVDVIQRIDYKPAGYEKIETEDADNLLKCYEILKRKLPEYIDKFNVSKEDILIDYTGGTKTMSAALVLASIDLGYNFSYISGKERNKDGLGVVKSGTEEPLIVYNPYDFYAVELNKRFETLFNTCRFSTALDVLEDILNKIGERELKYIYKILKEITRGYLEWDNFNHKLAKDFLSRGHRDLEIFCAGSQHPEYKRFCLEARKNLEFLEMLNTSHGEFLVYDLIANADRRAQIEGRYDDAMARLYRALEKIAQNELLKLGINASKVPVERIPEDLREEYKRKYYDEEIKTLKLPLYASYRLLNHLENEIGRRFMENYEKSIKGILDTRNNSILAHGELSVTREKYEGMRDILLDFIGGEKRLPKFPELEIEIFL